MPPGSRNFRQTLEHSGKGKDRMTGRIKYFHLSLMKEKESETVSCSLVSDSLQPFGL